VNLLPTGLSVLILSASLGCVRHVPAPVPAAGEAPLERALAALGLNSDDLYLPRASEAGYHIPTSFPALDAALAEPLALPPLAEQLGQRLDLAQTPLAILRAAGRFQPGGTAAGPGGDEEAPEPVAQRRPAPSPTELIDSAAGQLLLAHFPEAFRLEVRALCLALETTATRLDSCKSDGPLRPPPRAAEEFFLEPWAGQSRYRNHPTGIQEEFLAYAQTVDLGCVRSSSEQLLATLNDLLPRLRQAAEELPESGGAVIQLDTSIGPVLIGSRGPDVYALDAALVLDPGGDDRWTAGAGSNLGLPSPISLAIDLAGNDNYSCDRSHCQGSGFGGVGILIDQGEGNDAYFAGSQAQGAALLGFGLLWDDGGNDSYQADSYGQGAGTLGVGLLLDSGGNDRNIIRARGQGFAATGGLGIYADLGGDDQRRLGLPGESPHGPFAGGGQGAAWGTRSLPWYGASSLHGGVGLLYDRAGNDSYYARAYGQGYGWMLSLGMLLDRAGNDHYVAEWFGQGAAQHLAAGLLIDGAGQDLYEGSNSVQAAALDRSTGILWDRGDGADRYRIAPVGSALVRELGAGQAWAAQPHALAVLVDEAGDDSYATVTTGMAYSLPPSRPDRPALAFFMDTGGSDSYSLGQPRSGGSPAQGATWLQPGASVGMDTHSAHPGWAGASAPAAPLAGFSYAPGPPPAREGSDLPPGDLDGDATARWAALESAYRSRLDPATEIEPIHIETIRDLARTDSQPAVRRAAARLLVARGEVEGLTVLIDSLSFHSEETHRPSSISSLPYWLSIATGIPEHSSYDDWREAWRQLEGQFDPSAGWERVRTLDTILLASGRGDLTPIQDLCDTSRDSNLAELQPACAQLLGFWAWTLGHPESGSRRNLALAIELGQQAILLAPGEAEHFVNLARTLHGQGHRDLALRALDQAEFLDPDAFPLLALKRQLDDEAEQ
jgi:hypothetical protein